MNISVIICSINRPAILHETVASIASQSRKPAEILIVTPGDQHVLPETLAISGLRVVIGPLGLPSQRNAGLDRVSPECDLVAFFDDDIELSEFYLDEMLRLFSENPEIVVASGRLLHDGGRSTVVTRSQARELCHEHDRNCVRSESRGDYHQTNSAYGCNMMVRCATARNVRFDEGLPLYAWLEDRDYSQRVTKNRHGPVEFQGAIAVHLGSRSGRIGGVRMGFSEIINPIYLWAKNRTFSLGYIVVQYWARCLVGNILGILARDSEYDRVGLLRGNMIGLWHLLTGSCDPGHITEI
jgi:GT2 family glycosyltransferase